MTEDDEAAEDTIPVDEPLISLHAMAGVTNGDTMQLPLVLGATTLMALLDFSSTNNFIAEHVAERAGLATRACQGLRIMVANGDRMPCLGIAPATSFSIDGEEFTSDFFVLPLGGYDVVLGTAWLTSLGPILWDFRRLTLAFWRTDHQVCWQGSGAPQRRQLLSTSGPDLVQPLLDDFADVFAMPAGLPPPRSRDHHIHLLPGTDPIAVRPYRYAQLQKDELERQCRAMEEQGIIRRSTSPFSAPVLLVRKADDLWRFCVDYRALNERTVKDKFPIPMVEELLDELHGAYVFSKLDLR